MLYRKLLESAGPDPEIAAAAARLHLELEEPAEAMDVLRSVLDERPIPRDLVAPIAEALYSTGRFGLLRDLSGQLLAAVGPSGRDEPVRDALQLWANPHA